VLATYRRILAEQPNNYMVLNNLAYSLLEVEGAEEEAVELAARAYELARTNPGIMDTYGLALLKQGDYRKADLVLRQAIQEQQRMGAIVPAEFYYHLGKALAGKGELESARKQYETALERLDEAVAATPDIAGLRAKIERAQAELE